MYKSLLIVFLIYTCIEINGGMNYGDNDDYDMFSQFNDLSGGPPSPGEKIFRELYDTPEQHTNVERCEESSRPTIVFQQVIRKTEARLAFLDEIHRVIEKKWNDLRNESYVQAWPTLCYVLWDNEAEKKMENKKCFSTPMHKGNIPFLSHRVVDPSIKTRMYADLLHCKCHNSKFYITKCFKTTFDNYYYILELKDSSTLQVSEMRYAIFDPGFIL